VIHRFENQLFADIHSKLSLRNRQQLDTLLTETTPDGGDPDVDPDADIPSFSRLKRDPGRIGLKSILKEIAKLKRIEDVQLPDDLFADVSSQTLERLRLRVTTESLQALQRHPDPIRYTLLAAFCWQRREALIDALDWLKSHRNNRGQFINCAEIPIDGIVRPQLQDLLFGNRAERGSAHQPCQL
jgi:hypothetical protein